jgi:hypothetical protein
VEGAVSARLQETRQLKRGNNIPLPLQENMYYVNEIVVARQHDLYV